MITQNFSWPGDRDSNPGRCDPQRFSRPPLSTTQPSPENEEKVEAVSGIEHGAHSLAGLLPLHLAIPPDNFWRRHPDSNRGSGLCRPVPYHLAMSPNKMVPGAGLEPARTNVRGILSPLRLPIPPSGQYLFGFKLSQIVWIQNLWSGRRGSNPRPRPWQGRALPLSYSRIFWDRYYIPNFPGCKVFLPKP